MDYPDGPDVILKCGRESLNVKEGSRKISVRFTVRRIRAALDNFEIGGREP